MKRWLAIPMAAIAASVVGVASYGSPTTHAGTPPTAVSIDCDASTPLVVDPSPCVYGGGPVTVGVIFTNGTGGAVTIGTFNFTVVHPNDGLFDAPTTGAGLDANPDFTADATDTGDWACGPPNPDDDLFDPPADVGEDSFLSCFNAIATGPVVAADANIQLATITYNVTGTGVEAFSLVDVGVADDTFTEIMSCNPVVTTAGACNDSSVQIGASAATNTPTNTPTATAVPTETPTPCTGGGCPTPTSLAFVTVTPTPCTGTDCPTPTPCTGDDCPTATAPAGETPGAPPPPPPPPGGTTGGGGTAPITLPDTGSGGEDSRALLGENVLLLIAAMVAAATLSGGIVLTANTNSRRGED